ncbi:hypothetical protein SAMN02927921_03990 [Sinomicrobium oceani]|uniref:Uncharacterized protein n=1 Tax=Sinomicrobium oceani TaxID=1150368 RepID=A0A1K1RUI3_9FLAO|nr:hypothetical protein SAMN02927921_03990 [Sinomicrobium oceani]
MSTFFPSYAFGSVKVSNPFLALEPLKIMVSPSFSSLMFFPDFSKLQPFFNNCVKNCPAPSAPPSITALNLFPPEISLKASEDFTANFNASLVDLIPLKYFTYLGRRKILKPPLDISSIDPELPITRINVSPVRKPSSSTS